jgi:acyl-CoA synthetase (AMP-forming)/AMP-acid ligase II
MEGLMMDYPLTVDRILEHANRLFPRKRVITIQPGGSVHTYTFADLYTRTKRLANALIGLGINAGDRVGTFAWNSFEHLEMYYGIPGAGAVCHTLNLRLSPEQLAFVINHAGDRVVFIDGTLVPLFAKVLDRLESVEHFVVHNPQEGNESLLPGLVRYEDLLEGASDDFEWRSTDENSAMGLCYTSGTTGDPKGALYSHRSTYLHALGVNQSTALGTLESDIILPVVPQFHAMAWGVPFLSLMCGAELLMPGPYLQAVPLADMIEEHRVTVAAGVPSIWNGLYRELVENPRDTSCVRSVVVGGSAMPQALIEGFERDLGMKVVHAWGMTETSPVGTVSRLLKTHEGLSREEKWAAKARQGYPVFGIEIRIVDEDGNELAWDGKQMGELQVRGPWVVRQYFRREPEPEHFTDDGWFRTGDVALVSPDGVMTLTDRTKDLIKSGGEWISSVALENALMAHTGVVEAAVIAIPDPRWAERPLAVVVPEPDANLTEGMLREFLAPDFAKFWLPDRVVFLELIPKTSVGKFDKKQLRSMHAEGRLSTTARPE